MSTRRSNVVLLDGLLMAVPLTGTYVGSNIVCHGYGDSLAQPAAT